MANKRIFVTANDEQQDYLNGEALKQDRKVSYIATKLFNDGYNLTKEPESNISYQQRIADELVKKKDNG